MHGLVAFTVGDIWAMPSEIQVSLYWQGGQGDREEHRAISWIHGPRDTWVAVQECGDDQDTWPERCDWSLF